MDDTEGVEDEEDVESIVEEPGIKELTDDEIMMRMLAGVDEGKWQLTPDKDEDGCRGYFCNKKNFFSLGISDNLEVDEAKLFSGTNYRPFVEFKKDDALLEVKKMGFASDFHKHESDIKKFPGEKLLLIWDNKKLWGDGNNFVLVVTEAAMNRELEKLSDIRERVKLEYEESLRPSAGGGGGDGADGGDDIVEDLSIVVRDAPKECKPWWSPHMDETHKSVANFSVHNSRPLMQVMITRPRSQFGKGYKHSDSPENLQNCRQHKDPNFALFRRVLETGIQAVREVCSASCQTTWYRPVNKSTQYSPSDFLRGDRDLGSDQVDELTEFLASVSIAVEEALQTNETVDIFQEEFDHIGEDEAGSASKTHSNLRESRNFVDVTYTRGKRIEWIEWVPGSTDMLAASYCENQCFTEKLEASGRATVSHLLIWSFRDLLQPHCVLVSPWEVPVFKFYPSDEKYLIGGLSSGQLAVWKLADADLGHSQRDRAKAGGAQGDDEKASGGSAPQVTHKQVSIIDESHKKAIVAIEWLPPVIEIERRGRGASEKNPKDGPIKYFVTTAGDGQVMIWDIQAMLESVNDHDFIWKPVHKIQLQRQDSGTEMGCCNILYCTERFDEKGVKQLTNFYAGTEEGELIFGDWAARGEEDRKPELIKKMYTVSKTFRPMLSLERSPFYDILLAVTDWAFYLFKDGLPTALFQSSYTSTYFTCGTWSPTRPSVIFLGLVSGGIDIWDFSDQSHKASLVDVGASVAISSMVFLRGLDEKSPNHQLAVGDAHGHLHVHILPANLVRRTGKEKDAMAKFLAREEVRVRHFQERRKELSELKDEKEKQAQMATDKDEVDKGKKDEDVEKADAIAEAAYQKLELECKESLGL